MVAIITRRSNWEELLALYIDRVRDQPFEWGQHDCAHFAAGAVKAITGVDLMEGWRGQYTDARSAAEGLRARGLRTLKGAVCHYLGRPMHPVFARRGDVVMRHKALGVCHGRGAWFVGAVVNHEGLVHVALNECQAGWRIPFSAGRR